MVVGVGWVWREKVELEGTWDGWLIGRWEVGILGVRDWLR